MSAIATVAPSRAIARACAAPMPRAAPVISATLPARRPVAFMSRVRSSSNSVQFKLSSVLYLLASRPPGSCCMSTTTMRAIRLTQWQSDPVLTEVPVPAPRGAEVLVEVAAAGLCRTDLHLMSSPPGAYPYTLPFTLGHESAGRVAALGPDASGFEAGD